MRHATIRRILITSVLVLSGLGSGARAGGELPDSADGVHPLMIGADAPDVTVLDGAGEPVELGELIRDRRTVLIFYRGGW